MEEENEVEIKLTTKQIQQIIKEELNRVLYEVKGLPKGITVRSLIPKIIKALKSKKLEPIDLARINHLFKFFLRGDKSESGFAKKWIESFYKDFPEFKKIVDNDFALTHALNPSSEFVSTQKDISDTVNTPTGITTPDLYNYKKNLRHAKLKGTYSSATPNIIYDYLKGVDLRGANLYGKKMSRAYLWRADLSEAYLSKADLRRANLNQADLSYAKLNQADLSNADLRDAFLLRTKLFDANLSGADLRHATLAGANLRKANLYGADLRGADLGESSLVKANLRGANLEGAELKGASYDDETKWPEGFDPIKAGARKV